jgi:hypothetical protein
VIHYPLQLNLPIFFSGLLGIPLIGLLIVITLRSGKCLGLAGWLGPEGGGELRGAGGDQKP